MQLGVNVDHVATLRNLRGTTYPSIVELANIAVEHGADFITVHLREDRRHVRDDDLYALKKHVNVPINLEMAATEEMLAIAKELSPEFVCLVPEKREEVTTESGLDTKLLYDTRLFIISELQRHGIKVTLFLDPSEEDIACAKRMNVDKIELHVGAYCISRAPQELEMITRAAQLVHEAGMICHAGHGIDYECAAAISKVKHITAINVGHFLVCEAITQGMGNAVRKMKDIITS
ncbi:pyridoxine 5'-phosphate synthase [Anaplasma phagocytophilum]|uniref:Pyridoxine 5'-phosphate synthase n=10 Tax=Anaplasma phagocytophilum TaxID=948 RepID=PDXJ_ANAPZ|nr:pyridoxine 5'-phosphate synthase [Anaplasma phagocytophilum]Q2GJT4.1 RecName: Full=Pyridoxine 5'-phosphate synthase; Short=PNP synthase [Anaplasma phagocytophilum str. HZ]KJV64593.1 pyridoxine 5'-phosphate synthase [Anaplasma phagocytophilum str. ApMUC09]KJV67524.1 pyridoxine 5'-phosphate synthase [Anaplasma phagocytophilum str. ApNP]KJZ99332.1 pyridoxine 5'-phosphate synthase [Anaplasma phagocytophilum str. CR1007]ABD43567.1 pyridoxal phosphate biosynthesis protein PdxJ [Anaplasma phagocyt